MHAFFDECGFGPKLELLRTAAEQRIDEVSSMVGLEPLALAAATRALYAHLFRSGGDNLVPFGSRLRSAAASARVRSRVAQAIAATHRSIHEVVSRRESGYVNQAAILLHSPDEVETLLDVSH